MFKWKESLKCQFLLSPASQLPLINMMETMVEEGKIAKEWEKKVH